MFNRMASTVSIRLDCSFSGSSPAPSTFHTHATRRRRLHLRSVQFTLKNDYPAPWRFIFGQNRRSFVVAPRAGSRADDSASFDMSVENALKVLGVSDGASFEDVVRAKNSILATCKDDPETIAKVEAAYDMLLIQSLSQRRAGKVASNNIRYADVKPATTSRTGTMPRWLQTSIKNSPISVEAPSTEELGTEVGVYGVLMALSYISGASMSSVGPYAGSDGLILATSFGASLYFMTKKKVKLGKATLVTIGGLVAGAVVGSVVEKWLQVDIVPFLGIHSPTTVVSEIILVSQLLVSLYLR